MNPRASEQNNNSIWDLTKENNSFVLHTIFISDDCLNYSEQDATEKRSTIKQFFKRSGMVSNSDDQRWL